MVETYKRTLYYGVSLIQVYIKTILLTVKERVKVRPFFRLKRFFLNHILLNNISLVYGHIRLQVSSYLIVAILPKYKVFNLRITDSMITYTSIESNHQKNRTIPFKFNAIHFFIDMKSIVTKQIITYKLLASFKTIT